tara:strand:- start:288 stop:539 length:252 start_codon:yes stop_codon:yes gene_type:complete
MESEIVEKEYKMILSTITKCVFIVSIAVAFSLWGYSCKLNSETIQECESACASSDSQIESVTYKECRCQQKLSNESQWVIPRR